jgi:hypothetical protein
MLQKIKNKPLWYQLWAISVAISAIYYLIRHFFFEPSALDRAIEVYALVSLLVDYVVVPKTATKNSENS